jgi:hypothetical protein
MFTTLRHFGYAVQPRKVEPVRLWRTFIGSPHSSQVVFSISDMSTASSSGSGMSCVKVHSG